MTKDDIVKLAERISSGVATDEDILVYNRICNSLQSDTEEWNDHDHGSKKEMASVIKKTIWKEAGIEAKVFQIRRYKWVAAAAILATISIAALYFIKPVTDPTISAKIQPQSKRFKNDVAPGKHGAILTLSDGETIMLDSANNGTLAVQGVDEVIKKDGQIIYKNGHNSTEIVYNTMTTPNGRQYKLVLADGTSVWLNAASSITFPTAFSGKERSVTITGEVYFEVAHNAQKPFIVQKGETRIEVLGTHFNMNTYEDENSLNVTLLEGSVKVTQGNLLSLIKPGQQAQLKKDGLKLLNNTDIDAVMAWKNGTFQFEGEDMKILMRQLSRWYDVEVEYKKEINDLFYAEISRNTNLSDALRTLELTGKVKFEINGKKIIVMP